MKRFGPIFVQATKKLTYKLFSNDAMRELVFSYIKFFIIRVGTLVLQLGKLHRKQIQSYQGVVFNITCL